MKNKKLINEKIAILVLVLLGFANLQTVALADTTSTDFSQAITSALTVTILDGSNVVVVSPSVTFSSLYFSNVFQTSTGTLGSASQKIRVSNLTATDTWNLAIAATAGPTAVWNVGGSNYDFNDDGASATDNAGGTNDADSYGGQLTVNPSVGTLTAVGGGCSNTNVSKGSSTPFNEGTTDSVTVLTAASGADVGCKWDFINASLSQTIPAVQAVGSYTLPMTLTVS